MNWTMASSPSESSKRRRLVKLEDLISELEEFCASNELALEPLQEKLRRIPQNAVYRCPLFLCNACSNQRVTLEIIEAILRVFPEAADGCGGAHDSLPLQLACMNDNCPGSVIEMLTAANPSAHKCSHHNQLPIHHYLSRASDVDHATVKMFVEACPDVVSICLNRGLNPLRNLFCNESISTTALKDIFFLILEKDNETARLRDEETGNTPLHFACMSNIVDAEIVQILLDFVPESASIQNHAGEYPIQILCLNDNLHVASSEILKLLIKTSPESLRHVDRDGFLPIHFAIWYKPFGFCKILLDTWPESAKIATRGVLPIHQSCMRDYHSLDKVKYLLKLDPESIHARTNDSREGHLPIHFAAKHGSRNVNVLRFLLSQDPTCASERAHPSQRLPLHLVCQECPNLFATQLFPEALTAIDRNGDTPLDLVRRYTRADPNQPEVMNFLETQLVYARQAQDILFMNTTDSKGWLPLHHALNANASLGAIKLLVEGNMAAVQVADECRSFPLHIACEFCTADIVNFLMELYVGCLNELDINGNSPLHRACLGGNCSVIKYLLKRKVTSISEPNASSKLPIHLLTETGGDKAGRSSLEYLDAIFHLLRAHPETVMNQ